MSEREPALLIILIETAACRWHVGAIASDGKPFPIFQSESGNLDQYSELEPDAQVSFLRHRLAGVLQRGCDRLYPRNMKASRFLFVADGNFTKSADDVTQRLAEHFVEWMMNPPVTFVLVPTGFAVQSPDNMLVVAGELPDDLATTLRISLPSLVSRIDNSDEWELIVRSQQTGLEK